MPGFFAFFLPISSGEAARMSGMKSRHISPSSVSTTNAAIAATATTEYEDSAVARLM